MNLHHHHPDPALSPPPHAAQKKKEKATYPVIGDHKNAYFTIYDLHNFIFWVGG